MKPTDCPRYGSCSAPLCPLDPNLCHCRRLPDEAACPLQQAAALEPSPLIGDRCRCGACGESFNSTFTFERHRVGTFEPLERCCLSVAQMLAQGFRKNKAGYWVHRATRSRPSHWRQEAA